MRYILALLLTLTIIGCKREKVREMNDQDKQNIDHAAYGNRQMGGESNN